MATVFTKEMGSQLVGGVAFCLRADDSRKLFGWFDLSNADKEALLGILRKLLGEDIELDMAGLRRMIEEFLKMTNPLTMRDKDRDYWSAVANGAIEIEELELDTTGRRIWYEFLREEGDSEWTQDDEPPD